MYIFWLENLSSKYQLSVGKEDEDDLSEDLSKFCPDMVMTTSVF